MFERILRMIKENFSVVPFREDKFEAVVCSPYDNQIAREWRIKWDISNAPNLAKKSREGVYWSFPMDGWAKANFDGAAKGNPGKARCGGVLKDSIGNFMGVVATPLGVQTNHVAEAVGSYYIINLVVEIKCKNLWLEGDSKNIIDSLCGRSQPTWSIKNWIEDAKVLLSKFNRIKITHAYREANAVADYFANEGVKMYKILTWHKRIDLHSDVQALMMLDAVNGKVATSCNNDEGTSHD